MTSTPRRPHSVRVALLALVGTAAVRAQSGFLPEILEGPVPNPRDGHVYYLLLPSTWTQAESKALQLGGHLVTINDDQECDWIANRFSFWNGTPRALWCGLSDQIVEGDFRWISGESAPFLNWGDGEPNVDPGSAPTENYVFLYPTLNPRERRWRDTNDFAASDFVNDPRWAPAPDSSFGCHGLVEVVPVNPHVVESHLRLQGQQALLGWNPVVGSTYQVQTSPEPSGPWTNMGSPIIGTTNSPLAHRFESTNQKSFFRVLMVR